MVYPQSQFSASKLIGQVGSAFGVVEIVATTRELVVTMIDEGTPQDYVYVVADATIIDANLDVTVVPGRLGRDLPAAATAQVRFGTATTLGTALGASGAPQINKVSAIPSQQLHPPILVPKGSRFIMMGRAVNTAFFPTVVWHERAA